MYVSFQQCCGKLLCYCYLSEQPIKSQPVTQKLLQNQQIQTQLTVMTVWYIIKGTAAKYELNTAPY